MNLRSIGTRTVAAVGALGAVAGLTAAVAGAQTAPGRGPFASGMLTSQKVCHGDLPRVSAICSNSRDTPSNAARAATT